MADEITIVAVGDAEKEKESLYIEHSSSPDLKPEESKVISNIAKIIQDDFSFYQHIFDVQKSGARFHLSLMAMIKDGKVVLTYELKDTKEKKSLL